MIWRLFGWRSTPAWMLWLIIMISTILSLDLSLFSFGTPREEAPSYSIGLYEPRWNLGSIFADLAPIASRFGVPPTPSFIIGATAAISPASAIAFCAFLTPVTTTILSSLKNRWTLHYIRFYEIHVINSG